MDGKPKPLKSILQSPNALANPPSKQSIRLRFKLTPEQEEIADRRPYRSTYLAMKKRRDERKSARKEAMKERLREAMMQLKNETKLGGIGDDDDGGQGEGGTNGGDEDDEMDEEDDKRKFLRKEDFDESKVYYFPGRSSFEEMEGEEDYFERDSPTSCSSKEAVVFVYDPWIENFRSRWENVIKLEMKWEGGVKLEAREDGRE